MDHEKKRGRPEGDEFEAALNLYEMFRNVLEKRKCSLEQCRLTLSEWLRTIVKGEKRVTARYATARHNLQEDQQRLEALDSALPNFSDLIDEIAAAILKVNNEVDSFQYEIPQFFVDDRADAHIVAVVSQIVSNNVQNMNFVNLPNFDEKIDEVKHQAVAFFNTCNELEYAFRIKTA